MYLVNLWNKHLYSPVERGRKKIINFILNALYLEKISNSFNDSGVFIWTKLRTWLVLLTTLWKTLCNNIIKPHVSQQFANIQNSRKVTWKKCCVNYIDWINFHINYCLEKKNLNGHRSLWQASSSLSPNNLIGSPLSLSRRITLRRKKEALL